jgi:hypothetical protein
MANLIRSAMSGSEWSINKLLAYRIIVKYLLTDQFWGRSFAIHLDPALLTAPPGTPDQL